MKPSMKITPKKAVEMLIEAASLHGNVGDGGRSEVVKIGLAIFSVICW